MPSDPRSREARLAAKLRENLHRRKAQARALHAEPVDAAANGTENDSDALSKPPRES